MLKSVPRFKLNKSLLLTFAVLLLVLGVGTKVIFAASDNSNRPNTPPGQAKKEENSQNNNNQGNNNGNSGQGNGQGKEDHKITICHLPPGNPANAQSIEIDKNAWETGHSPHNSHALDFIVDGSHPCPPKNNPGGGDNNGGNSSNNNGGTGGSGVDGASTSPQKQGGVLGAATLAATGSAETQLAMTLLQMLGAAAATIGWVAYGAKKA